LITFRISDRVTGRGGAVRAVIVGVEIVQVGEQPRLIRDAELLERLNAISLRTAVRRARPGVPPASSTDITAAVTAAQQLVNARLATISPEFAVPTADLLAIVWTTPDRQSLDSGGGEEDVESMR
jgi:hypothetical protein